MEAILPTVKEYILENFLPGEDPARLTGTTELVHNGVLNSMATLQLVGFLEGEFGIELEAHDVVPSNLNTLLDIENMVRRKLAVR
jgi:acyl carrier protein